MGSERCIFLVNLAKSSRFQPFEGQGILTLTLLGCVLNTHHWHPLAVGVGGIYTHSRPQWASDSETCHVQRAAVWWRVLQRPPSWSCLWEGAAGDISLPEAEWGASVSGRTPDSFWNPENSLCLDSSLCSFCCLSTEDPVDEDVPWLSVCHGHIISAVSKWMAVPENDGPKEISLLVIHPGQGCSGSPGFPEGKLKSGVLDFIF